MPQQIPLAAILNELLRASAVDLDDAIEAALGRICVLLDGKRAWLFRADGAGGHVCSHVAQMSGPGAASASDFTRPEVLIEPWLQELRDGQSINLADTAVLPEGLAAREALVALGVRSCLLAPLAADGELAGLICFECGVSNPDDCVEELAMLKCIADFMHTLLERRSATRQQIETANRLEATLAAIPDLLFEVDVHGRYTGFVAGPEHLMVVSADQLPGKELGAVLPPDVAKLAHFALREVFEKGRVANVLYRLDLPGGRFVFDLTGSLRPAAEPGQPPTAIFLVRDVTQTMQMREEVLRMGRVVQAMHNLVIFVDADQRITWVNPAFEQHTGWRLDEIRGKELGPLVRCAESDPAAAVAVARAIKDAVPYSGQTINQDRYGNRYWIDFNILPLYGTDGALQGYVSVETVVTRLKEQEKAMAALAETAAAMQSRLENAIRALPDGVVIFDADDRLIVANQSYRDSFPELADVIVQGVKLQDLLAAGAERGLFAAPTDAATRERWLAERVEQYRHENYSDEVQLPDGRWMRRINNRTADGGCIAVGIDITARRNQLVALDAANAELTRALAERDRAERRLTRIMDGAEVGTWEWDIKSGILHIGGHWGRIIGHDAEVNGKVSLDMFRDNVHPDDLMLLDAQREEDTAQGGEIIEREFRMRHSDGHWVWVLSRGRVTERDRQGRPSRLAGVHLDISERKRLEHEIHESQTHQRLLMDNSVAAIAVLDQNGVIEYANREAERILGVSRSRIRGRLYNAPEWRIETLDGKLLPDARLPFRRALTAGKTVRDIRFALHWPDGTRRVLSCNATPINSGEDRQDVVVSFWDITDQLAATERLEEALTRAEEMSHAKSIFLANMSHEIRTPLNGVLGMAEVLGMQLGDPDHRRMISTIRQSGETLLAVLNSILDMSKIEAGKMELEQVPLVMHDIVAQMEALYSVQAEEKGIEFEVLSSAGCEKPRLGDPHRVQQILNNLLNNAIKFTAQGSVTLKVSCRPGKPVVIEVTDTGVGMTPAQVARAFESFEQADGSMTRRFGGTGLGLSIVRQLVALMDGEITLESEAEQGTCVRVTLPLSETDLVLPEQRPELEAAPHELSLAGVRILSADDNATNRLVLAEMLVQTEAALHQVENGQEALDLWHAAQAEGSPFDLLLLDITMPVRDGMSTIAEIRRIEAEVGRDAVPAIAVTANAMPYQVAEYIIQGFDTHLAKPFKQRDLLHAVKSLLRA